MRPTSERQYGRYDDDDTSEIPRVPRPRQQPIPDAYQADYRYESRTNPQQPIVSGSKTHVWLLGALSFVLFLTVLLGAFYTITLINDRSGQIDDLEGEVAALSGEKQALSGHVTTLTTERDDARTTVSNLEGDVAELERQLSQARGDASREQGRANTAEAIGGVLAQIVIVDAQIHEQYDALLVTLDSMYMNFTNRNYNAVARDWDAMEITVIDLDRLFVQRDTLMGQLQ